MTRLNSSLRLLSLLSLLVLVLAISCKKDDNDDDSSGVDQQGVLSDHAYLSGVFIDTHFRGRVLDESGDPLAGVVIQMGSRVTSTDTDGIWELFDVTVDSERAYVTAEKEGYFTGSRVLHPEDDVFNRADIILMTAAVNGAVSSASGGTVIHPSGSSVELPADGFVDGSGTAYNGLVDVSICYLDPSVDDFLTQMPGDLTALEADDDFVALMSYGMIGVELTGSGGEELQLADEAMATINVPVPDAGLGTAPISILLWHFDEEEGVWKEEGSAELQGNSYVGEVSHFSFWNCDIPTEYVFVEGVVLSPDGLPLSGIHVVITSGVFGQGQAYTDAEGYYGGIIPADEVLVIEFLTPCGEVVFSQEIGPFSSDATLDDFYYTGSSDIGYISGTLVDCDMLPTDGYFTYDTGFPETIPVDGTGDFLVPIICSPQQITCWGYDDNYLDASFPIEVTTIADEEVDLGNLSLCETTMDEYVIVEILGETFGFVDSVQCWSSGMELSMFAYNVQGMNDMIAFSFDDTPNPEVTESESNYLSIDGIFYYLDDVDPDLQISFSNYTQVVGGYLEFSFNGTFYPNNDPGSPVIISGNARVQRLN